MMRKALLVLIGVLFAVPVLAQSTAPVQDLNAKYVDGAEVTSYTQYGIPFWSLTAILDNLAPPTDARPHLIVQAGTGSAAQAPTEPALGQPDDACNTTSTYTVLTTDDGRLKCQSGSTASTWTIGTAAGGTGFDQNWFVLIANNNSSGNLTVSATTSTFRSSASTSLVIEPGVMCSIVGNSANNWDDYCTWPIASGTLGISGTSPVAVSAARAISINANGITATQLASQYSTGACTEVWGGSGTSFALTSGDDAIINNSCYNDSGVPRHITAVKCRSDNSSNTTTVNPTFGSAGTGTTILSGALTCGSSYAFSSTGTVSNASWTTGSGIDPAMAGTLTGTSIAMIVEYTY